jgi:hypothetical protein
MEDKMGYQELSVLRRKEKSELFAVSSTSFNVELDKNARNYSHNFIGVFFYSDAAGTTEVTPSAGTVDIKVKLENSPNTFEDISNGSYSANAPQSASFSGNPTDIQITLASIAGASYFKVILIQNKS